LPQALPFFGQATSTTYYSYAAVPSSAPAVYDAAAAAAAAAPPLAPSLPLPMQQSQPYLAAAAQAQPYYVSAASTGGREFDVLVCPLLCRDDLGPAAATLKSCNTPKPKQRLAVFRC